MLVDLFYDHLLARDWPRHANGTLDQFTSGVYAALTDYETFVPERAREAVDLMSRHNWLGSYRHVEAVGQAIDRMSVYRLQRANPLAGGIEEFLADPAGYEADFDAFLPDALAFAAQWRAARDAR